MIPGLEQLNPDIATRVGLSVLLAVVLYLLTFFIGRRVVQTTEDPTARQRLRRAVNLGGLTLGLIGVSLIWLGSFVQLLLVLLAIVLYIAFTIREVAGSAVGAIWVVSGHLFAVGDRVEIGGVRGDVVGITIVHTTLMEIGGWVDADQHSGRLVEIPNAVVLQKPIYNYTRAFPFVWDEIQVPISYHSNWCKALEICRDRVDAHMRATIPDAEARLEELRTRFNIPLLDLYPNVYLTFNDNWIELAVRYLSPVWERRLSKDQLSRATLAALQEAGDIVIASETVEVSGALGLTRDDGASPIRWPAGG